jgi:hypothetical protein
LGTFSTATDDGGGGAAAALMVVLGQRRERELGGFEGLWGGG